VQLLRVDPGFDYHNVLTLNIGLRLPTGQHIDDAYAARTAVYTQQVLEAVARVPGVQTAAAAYGGVPFTSGWARANVSLPGRGEQTIDDYDIDVRDVTPGYLELMRIPLRRGRYLVAGDAAGSQNVVVINEAAARKYWNGADPLGQHITINSTDRVVVGIVGNIHHLGPEIAPRQECYIAMAQARVYDAMLVARTAGDPMQVLPAVKAAIWSVNREQILSSQVVTLDRYLDRFMAQRRFNMAVLALLGALGLVIAAVGIYGVMAYLVTQRTTEIGVRMALGATRGAVVAMVLRRASLLLGAGLLIGGIASYALSASVKSFLFNLQPTDPRIFGAALVVLALAGLAATALPARRAAGVDPLVALRTN
jgi:predicted permease